MSGADTEVPESQLKALMGPAWTPKLRMIVTGNAFYAQRDGTWYLVSRGTQSAPESHHQPLEDPQAEREYWEHQRAAFEAGLEGEPDAT